MSNKGQPTPEEQVRDFVGESRKVTLNNGLEVTIATPKLRWWFDYLFPKVKSGFWSNADPELKKTLMKQLEKGKLTQDMANKLPAAWPDVVMEIVCYSTGKDEDWCKDNMDVVDLLNVANAFIEVCDPKRVMDFFVQICKQIPILPGMLFAGMPRGA